MLMGASQQVGEIIKKDLKIDTLGEILVVCLPWFKIQEAGQSRFIMFFPQGS